MIRSPVEILSSDYAYFASKEKKRRNKEQYWSKLYKSIGARFKLTLRKNVRCLVKNNLSSIKKHRTVHIQKSCCVSMYGVILSLLLFLCNPLYAEESKKRLSAYKSMGREAASLVHLDPTKGLGDIKQEYTDPTTGEKTVMTGFDVVLSAQDRQQYSTERANLEGKSYSDLESESEALVNTMYATEDEEGKLSADHRIDVFRINHQVSTDHSQDEYKKWNNPIYDISKDATQHGENYIGEGLSVFKADNSKYADCDAQEGEVIKRTKLEKCHRHIAYNSNTSCIVGNKVVLDANNIYQCKRTIAHIKKKCHRKRITTCKDQVKSVGKCSSDTKPPIKFSVTNGYLSFKDEGITIQRRSGVRGCNIVTIEFDIKVFDKSAIKNLQLFSGVFDGHISIRLSNAIVKNKLIYLSLRESVSGLSHRQIHWLGLDSGWYPAQPIPSAKYIIGWNYKQGEYCEATIPDVEKLSKIQRAGLIHPLGITNSIKTPINLIPLLAQGDNKLVIKLFTLNEGAVALDFKADFACCSEVEDSWSDWMDAEGNACL